MKIKHVIPLLAVLLLAAPALGQPTPEPTTKAPVVKVDAAAAPASAPTAATKDEPKVEGAAAGEDTKPDETKPEEEGLGYGGLAIQYAMKLGFFVVSLLLAAFIRVLMKKFGFEEQTAKVNDVLERAAGYAEQWALKKAKVEGAAKPGGPEKMKEAITFAVSLAKEYKLPDKAEGWWEGKLEAWLGVKNGG